MSAIKYIIHDQGGILGGDVTIDATGDEAADLKRLIRRETDERKGFVEKLGITLLKWE